jgi:hypothetical protein
MRESWGVWVVWVVLVVWVVWVVWVWVWGAGVRCPTSCIRLGPGLPSLLTLDTQGADIDWAYWRGDGTESNGTSRTFGAPAPFGVLNPTWDGPAAPGGVLLHALQPLMPAAQGPSSV